MTQISKAYNQNSTYSKLEPVKFCTVKCTPGVKRSAQKSNWLIGIKKILTFSYAIAISHLQMILSSWY